MFPLGAGGFAAAGVHGAKEIREASGDFDLDFQVSGRPVFGYAGFVWGPEDLVDDFAAAADPGGSRQAG